MKRIGILTAILLVVFIAAIGGVVLYGHAHVEPNHLQAVGFDMCGHKPCWKGITPGASNWNSITAIGIARDVKEVSRDEGNTIEFDAYGYYFNALEVNDRKLVALINVFSPNLTNPVLLDSSPKLGTVGDVLNMFGTPCGIGYPNGNTEIEFIYTNIYRYSGHK